MDDLDIMDEHPVHGIGVRSIITMPDVGAGTVYRVAQKDWP